MAKKTTEEYRTDITMHLTRMSSDIELYFCRSCGDDDRTGFPPPIDKHFCTDRECKCPCRSDPEMIWRRNEAVLNPVEECPDCGRTDLNEAQNLCWCSYNSQEKRGG